MSSRIPVSPTGYRGRIAPTPTGYLHLGHAHTFRIAFERARQAGGTLVYRQEDIDTLRCTEHFAKAAISDLHDLGLEWDEGPDVSPPGPYAPYCQSQRTALYQQAWLTLLYRGYIYPDLHSRSELTKACKSGLVPQAPPQQGEQDSECIFPPQWRPAPAWFQAVSCAEAIRTAATECDNCTPVPQAGVASADSSSHSPPPHFKGNAPDLPWPQSTKHKPQGCRFTDFNPQEGPATGVNWRFRVPEGLCICFEDGHYGSQSFTCGKDFGDFTLWRRDGVPAYELAVVVDDIAMNITEVVRGADLLRSTARQLLLYKALGATPPKFYHCPLVLDPATGQRLAKRADSLSLRSFLANGGKINPL